MGGGAHFDLNQAFSAQIVTLLIFVTVLSSIRNIESNIFHIRDIAVAYLEGFRRRYTGLGTQTMCPIKGELMENIISYLIISST